MVFRGRRQERREERHEGRREERRAVHYRMRQKLVSIGDDYWIEDGDGRRAYKVDRKALRVRETLNFDDPSGNTCCAFKSACCGSATRWRSRTRAGGPWPRSRSAGSGWRTRTASRSSPARTRSWSSRSPR